MGVRGCRRAQRRAAALHGPRRSGSAGQRRAPRVDDRPGAGGRRPPLTDRRTAAAGAVAYGAMADVQVLTPTRKIGASTPAPMEMRLVQRIVDDVRRERRVRRRAALPRGEHGPEPREHAQDHLRPAGAAARARAAVRSGVHDSAAARADRVGDRRRGQPPDPGQRLRRVLVARGPVCGSVAAARRRDAEHRRRLSPRLPDADAAGVPSRIRRGRGGDDDRGGGGGERIARRGAGARGLPLDPRAGAQDRAARPARTGRHGRARAAGRTGVRGVARDSRGAGPAPAAAGPEDAAGPRDRRTQAARRARACRDRRAPAPGRSGARRPRPAASRHRRCRIAAARGRGPRPGGDPAVRRARHDDHDVHVPPARARANRAGARRGRGRDRSGARVTETRRRPSSTARPSPCSSAR